MLLKPLYFGFLLVAFISIAGDCVEEKRNVVITTNFEKEFRDTDLKNSFNFFVISDWGWNGTLNQIAVAGQMSAAANHMNLKFIVSCGDNFQFNGVSSVFDYQWSDNYAQVYKKPSLDVDWYPVFGNHDYKGNTQAEIEYSKIDEHWKMKDRYYSFTRKINDSVSACFIFLDTPPLIKEYHVNDKLYPDIAETDTAKEIRWLKGVLSNSHEQWKLVFGHHPVFSASSFHGNTPEMVEKVKPLLEKYGVQFYFCGHDHDLQHLKDSSGTVDYFVTGTGGVCRRDTSDAHSVYSNSALAFSFVSLVADKALVAFIDTSGNAIYKYSRKLNK
jgi:tartrate-resistant acid phosphatase type 5